MKNRTLDIVLGYTCNNNCIFCLNPLKKPKDRSFEEIAEDLKKFKGKFNKVEFIGGEPTIRKDIIRIVSLAKKMGFNSIRISTNGRLYKYKKFCKKITDAGANIISFSLYGSNPEIHNAATRTPGSFKDTIEGIKNAVSNKNIKEVLIDTVVYQGNYKDLVNIAKLLIRLKIKRWHICDLIPEGRGLKFYKFLRVDSEDLSILNNLIKFSNQFQLINFVDFPHCIFNENTLKNKRIKIVSIKDRSKTKQAGYPNERIFFDNYGEFESKYKIKTPKCNICNLKNKCGGFWKEIH